MHLYPSISIRSHCINTFEHYCIYVETWLKHIWTLLYLRWNVVQHIWTLLYFTWHHRVSDKHISFDRYLAYIVWFDHCIRFIRRISNFHPPVVPVPSTRLQSIMYTFTTVETIMHTFTTVKLIMHTFTTVKPIMHTFRTVRKTTSNCIAFYK